VNYSLGRLYHTRLAGCSAGERRSAEAEPVLSRAAFHFKKALNADPDYAKAMVGLGHLELYKGRAAEGLEILRRAALTEPNDPLVRADYGVELGRQGQLEGAVKELRIAVLLAPDDPDLLLDLGAACLDAERFEEAIRVLGKALILAPDEARIASYLSYARQHVRANPP
jgi:Flp pilus assembly protein TadD